MKITSQSGWRVSLKGTDLSSRTSGAAFFRRRQGREKIVETSVRSDFSYQDCLLKALSNDRSGADAACSATRKSCLFLGRHARQRRSLVCSSGGMLGNAEVLFVPRAACSATPKSCFFLGRYAQQRRSLVSSSGAHRIENILSSPARWFY